MLEGCSEGVQVGGADVVARERQTRERALGGDEGGGGGGGAASQLVVFEPQLTQLAEAVEAAEEEGGGAVGEVIVPRVERREVGTLVDRGGQRGARSFEPHSEHLQTTLLIMIKNEKAENISTL